MAALSRLIFEGTKVAHLGPLNSKKVVVFLHGSGDTGQGIKDWVSGLIGDPSDALILFPTAKEMQYSLFGGELARVWHDRKELDIDGSEDTKGISCMVGKLVGLLAEIRAAGVDQRNLILGGFSQGGHVALHTAYHGGENNQDVEIIISKVFALSSFLSNRSQVFKAPRNVSIPLFLSTGTNDGMVAQPWVDKTRLRLAEAGVEVTYSTRPLGHEMDAVQLKSLLSWISD